MFNIFNLSYSFGLQVKYPETIDPFSILCLLISLFLVGLMIVGMLTADKLQFGQFFDKFKQNSAESKYIIVSLAYRTILGFMIALLNGWNDSGIIFVFIVSCFIGYLLYFEPFVDQWQNYRSLFMHSTHFVIVFVFLYYQIETEENEIESSTLFVPAYIQITMIFLSIMVSIAMLCRQIYLKFFNKNKVDNQKPNNSLKDKEDIFFETLDNQEISHQQAKSNEV